LILVHTCIQAGLNEETFEHHRSGLIADKLEKEPSLSYQTGDYWSQIVDKRYGSFLMSAFALNRSFEKYCMSHSWNRLDDYCMSKCLFYKRKQKKSNYEMICLQVKKQIFLFSKQTITGITKFGAL
jgi:hypothetical protein